MPLHHAGHLLVDVKAVVAKSTTTHSAPCGAHLVDHGLHVFVADAEGEFGEHPARVRDGHVGEGLPDHGDLCAAPFEHLVGREQLGGLVPFGVEDVLAQRRKRQLFSTISATRSLPSVNSQWKVIASGFSAFMTLTMS